MDVNEDPQVRQLIASAKTEDLGAGDLTSALMEDAAEPTTFRLIAKEPGVLAGREIATMVLAAYDSALMMQWASRAADGTAWQNTPYELATIRGPLGSLLSAERVLLNFLQRLCGVATATRAYVDAAAQTSATIFDTRKTTPGWRALEKYAVRCGGGKNHRCGLFDAVLIKDNHLAGATPDQLASHVFDMFNRIGQDGSMPAFVQVEAETVEAVGQLLSVVGIDMILLDNFTIEQLKETVALVKSRRLSGKVLLEASGGITLDTVREVARTGVDRISVGAITHSAVAIDLSLERV